MTRWMARRSVERTVPRRELCAVAEQIDREYLRRTLAFALAASSWALWFRRCPPIDLAADVPSWAAPRRPVLRSA
jgi:hypothetical protein